MYFTHVFSRETSDILSCFSHLHCAFQERHMDGEYDSPHVHWCHPGADWLIFILLITHCFPTQHFHNLLTLWCSPKITLTTSSTRTNRTPFITHSSCLHHLSCQASFIITSTILSISIFRPPQLESFYHQPRHLRILSSPSSQLTTHQPSSLVSCFSTWNTCVL